MERRTLETIINSLGIPHGSALVSDPFTLMPTVTGLMLSSEYLRVSIPYGRISNAYAYEDSLYLMLDDGIIISARHKDD